MKIDMVKFGKLLISRPAGKDAWLSIQSSLKEVSQKEGVILDFNEVSVLTPSWMDEFFTPLKEKFKKVTITNVQSSVINETMEFLEKLEKADNGKK